MDERSQKADEGGDLGGGGTPPQSGGGGERGGGGNKKKKQQRQQQGEAAGTPPAVQQQREAVVGTPPGNRPPAGQQRRRKGPTMTEQILNVAAATKERRGISLAALKKALSAKGYDVSRNNTRVNQTVRQLVRNGSLVQTAGVGASGSFRFNRTGVGGAAAGAGSGGHPRRERREAAAGKKKRVVRRKAPPHHHSPRRRAPARRKHPAKSRRPYVRRAAPRRPGRPRRCLYGRRTRQPAARSPPLKGRRGGFVNFPASLPFPRGRAALPPRLYGKYKPVRAARKGTAVGRGWSPTYGRRARQPSSGVKRQRRVAVKGVVGKH